MKLYDQNRAPNPRRVRIFLAEKGISIPLVSVELLQQEHKQAEFSALNPVQQVPALELDDGSILTESIAICRYLEELYPEPNLFGSTARERAEIEMWNRRIEFGLFAHVAAAVRHGHPVWAALEQPQLAEWASLNQTRIVPALDLLDRVLMSSLFIAGNRLTIADITALVAIDFMRILKLRVPDDMIQLQRWHAVMSARTSALEK